MRFVSIRFLKDINSPKTQEQSQSAINAASQFLDSPTLVRTNSKFKRTLSKLVLTKSPQPTNSISSSPLKQQSQPEPPALSLRTNNIFSVTQFYKTHPGGPDAVANELLKAHHDLVYQEGSLQMTYKELGSNVISLSHT